MHVSEMCRFKRSFELMAIFAISFVVFLAPAVAAEVSDWSPTDNNNNATPPSGWPEGMNPSQVNDTGRAMMGAIRRWQINGTIDNKTGAITTDGAASIAQSQAVTAYSIYNPTGAGPYYDAVRAVLINPVSSATQNTNAFGAYFQNNQVTTPTHGGAVGVFSFGIGNAADTSSWGGNTLMSSKVGGGAGIVLYGWESDFQANNTTDTVLGYIMAGSSTVQPASAVAFQINSLSVQSPGLAKWTYGFSCADGTTGNLGVCKYVGAQATTGANTPSQLMWFGYRDASNVFQKYQLNVDASGSFHFTDSAGAGANHSFYFDSLLNIKNSGSIQVGGFNAGDTGAGTFSLAKVAPPSVAPGAGWATIFATSGTNAGTCALEVIAGTSTSPQKFQDNIGAGC